MLLFASNFLITISIIVLYCFFILRKSNFPIINLYLITNVIIYYLPALIYITFGLTHPAMSYNYNNIIDYKLIFTDGIILILIFDILLIGSYLLFQNTKLFKFSNRDFFSGNLFEKYFYKFFGIVFFITIILDFFDLVGNNSFMNQDNIFCNPNLSLIAKIHDNINTYEFFSNIKQIISTFSNLKFYLLIITLYYYISYKNKKNLCLLTIIIIYNFTLAIILGSKFSIIFIIIIFFCIFYNYFLKLKNIIYASFIFFMSLYFFPIIGVYRALYTKKYNETECFIVKEKMQYIIENNLHLIKGEGLISYFSSISHLSEIFTYNNFINKPIEILLTRLNYFDITLRTINLKLKNSIDNNFTFYFDNIYSLIPRLFYPDKKIILNNSNYLAVELGILNHPFNAIGLRPIAEGFYYLGYYYVIIALILGLTFCILGKLFDSSNFLIKSSVLYISILILKRDSFHTIVPGVFHELIILIFLILIVYFIDFYKNKITK